MKKILSIMLAVILLITVVPLSEFSLDVSASSNIIIGGVDIGYAVGDYFTKNGKSCATSAFSNGTCHGHGICITNTDSRCNCLRYWPSKENCQIDLGATQCFGFARYCQWKLYGYHDGNASSKFTNLTGSVSKSNCTGEKLKAQLLGCAIGTHVRTGDDGHSLVIVSTSSSGLQIVSCNDKVNGVKVCVIRSKEYTWDAFATYLQGRDGVSYAKAFINGPSSSTTPPHTHIYTQYAESAHPHNVYMQCSCGDMYYTGATSINWTTTSYESTHPHNIYKTCSCGYTEYTGSTQSCWTDTTYETAHPHKVYNACSCGYKEYTGDNTTDRYCYTCIGDSYVESIEYNGHTYVLYQINTPWQYAKTFCESKDGHLATITDEAEWEFVKWFLEGKNTWLGGYLTPEQNWEWVTGEDFSFTDWIPGEPNNASGDEGYLGTYVDSGWNDFPNTAETVNYFLCEYEPLQYTQRVRYNNHTYDVYDKNVSWLEAYNICKEKGGHLVTVNDKSELAFLSGVIEGNVCWTAQYLDTIKSGLYFYYGVNPSTITTANIFICEYDPITITYDANGGENAPVAIEKAYEEDIVLNSAKPSCEGYVFLGWSDKSDAEYVEYVLGDSFKRNEDTTLYAMWQELTNVTFDENLSASIYVDGDKTQYFKFTPTTSGNYTINSIGDEDTYVYLYDANMNLIATDDDSGENSNFNLVQYLEANETYIYGVRFWDGVTGSLDFTLLKEAKETGDTNGDGKINGKDYALLLQSINGWDVTINEDTADVNDDNKINGKDYALLLQFINGWDVKLA